MKVFIKPLIFILFLLGLSGVAYWDEISTKQELKLNEAKNKTMIIIQTFRRLGQKSGWSKALSTQDAQMNIANKLYSKNGLELKLTCGACPEQYEVFKIVVIIINSRISIYITFIIFIFSKN